MHWTVILSAFHLAGIFRFAALLDALLVAARSSPLTSSLAPFGYLCFFFAIASSASCGFD
jgi:hypothetical protein